MKLVDEFIVALALEHGLDVEEVERLSTEGRLHELDPRSATRSLRPEGCVYFVLMGSGVIKIGHTVNLDVRLKNLQGGCADAIELIAVIPGGRRLERELHDIFRDERLRGEFFSTDVLDRLAVSIWL